MYLNDYGTMHLLHWLRSREIERKHRGIIYGLVENEPRQNRLVMRIQRLLQRSRLAIYMTRYAPTHQSSQKTIQQSVELS